MHFAFGMAGGGAVGIGACLLAGRGWRWLPVGMTLGGVWALVPDLPRIFREDFPSLPFASILGSRDLERSLHAMGDVFFLHARLDAQPRELALHGLVLILFLYNAGLILLLCMEARQRRAAIRARAAAASHALAAGLPLHPRTNHPAPPPARNDPPPPAAVLTEPK